MVKTKQLNKLAALVAIGATGLFANSIAMAAPFDGTQPMNSIADSYHNLGSGNQRNGTPNDPTGAGGSTANHSTATAEICVFCHTPHGGDNGTRTGGGSVAIAVPLWNRALASTQQWTRYSALGTTTFDAAEADIGSVTIACLSCHDGTQAIDAVLNKPGSGGWTDPASGGAPTALGGFTGTDQSGGRLLTTIVQNLGTDLSNDHPVSMQYGGGGWVNGGTPGDVDFIAPTPTTLRTGLPVWYVESGARTGTNKVGGITAGTRDRLDVILYTRDIGNGNEAFVECGSCHDPHNVDNPTFLRVANSDPVGAFAAGNGGPSSLCLTCHDK